MSWTVGLFALIGVVLGLGFEPIRASIAHRSHNRQVLVARCADVVSAAETSKRRLVGLNHLHRLSQASSRSYSGEQLSSEVSTYNAARADLSVAVALLRLSGPDALADRAEEIAAAVEAMHRLSQAPDDPDAESADLRPPRVLQEAQEGVDAALMIFCEQARPFARPTRMPLRAGR